MTLQALKKWLRIWISGKPHFMIGGRRNPYLLRWFVLPRNDRFGIYLHKFLRDDEDRALHDHPWYFISLMLWGGYTEVTPEGRTRRRWLSVAYRPAKHRHRVVLHGSAERRDVCWTLVFHGPRVREWGFWCPQGFVPWEVFTRPGAAGETGRGCE